MIYKPTIDIWTTNDSARLGKLFKMFIIFPFLAILLPTVFCENDLKQSNPELLLQLQKYENLPLHAKPCTRRFFPNPVIDSQWTPSLSPAQNLKASNEQRRSQQEDTQVERSQLNSESNTSDQNDEQSAEDDDLRKSQNDDSSLDLESRTARDESDGNKKTECDSSNQQEEQQYYRRFLSESSDLTNDNKASAKNNEEDELDDPVERSGVSSLSETRPPFSGNSRVCYACTSASNPHCLNPNKQTTVKYCQPNHDSCVTKTYINLNGNVVIRDCASSCRQPSIIGVDPKYKSCKLCHSDLCNSASTVTSHALMILLFIGTLLKCVKSSNI